MKYTVSTTLFFTFFSCTLNFASATEKEEKILDASDKVDLVKVVKSTLSDDIKDNIPSVPLTSIVKVELQDVRQTLDPKFDIGSQTGGSENYPNSVFSSVSDLIIENPMTTAMVVTAVVLGTYYKWKQYDLDNNIMKRYYDEDMTVYKRLTEVQEDGRAKIDHMNEDELSDLSDKYCTLSTLQEEVFVNRKILGIQQNVYISYPKTSKLIIDKSIEFVDANLDRLVERYKSELNQDRNDCSIFQLYLEEYTDVRMALQHNNPVRFINPRERPRYIKFDGSRPKTFTAKYYQE